jgi:hypothetical protein
LCSCAGLAAIGTIFFATRAGAGLLVFFGRDFATAEKVLSQHSSRTFREGTHRGKSKSEACALVFARPPKK